MRACKPRLHRRSSSIANSTNCARPAPEHACMHLGMEGIAHPILAARMHTCEVQVPASNQIADLDHPVRTYAARPASPRSSMHPCRRAGAFRIHTVMRSDIQYNLLGRSSDTPSFARWRVDRAVYSGGRRGQGCRGRVPEGPQAHRPELVGGTDPLLVKDHRHDRGPVALKGVQTLAILHVPHLPTPRPRSEPGQPRAALPTAFIPPTHLDGAVPRAADELEAVKLKAGDRARVPVQRARQLEPTRRGAKRKQADRVVGVPWLCASLAHTASGVSLPCFSLPCYTLVRLGGSYRPRECAAPHRTAGTSPRRAGRGQRNGSPLGRRARSRMPTAGRTARPASPPAAARQSP